MTSKLIVEGQENILTGRKMERSVQGERIAFPKVLRYRNIMNKLKSQMTRAQCVRRRLAGDKVGVHPFFFNVLGKLGSL